MVERFEFWRVFIVVYMFLCLVSDCGEIWLNLIRFAYIDCACTDPFLSRKSSTWHLTVLQPGVRLQRTAVFLHIRPSDITIVTVFLLSIFLYLSVVKPLCIDKYINSWISVSFPPVSYFGTFVTSSVFFQLDVRWEMVAYGKTQDQLELTEQAHNLLSMTNTLKPRSLNL